MVASARSPCVTVYFNNLHPCSHEAEIGSAQAYLKVQCNPVICRVVRKIHSPLTPIGVLSPQMQLIGTWCYLSYTEQFNTLSPPPLAAHTHSHPPTHPHTHLRMLNQKSTPSSPSTYAHAHLHTAASCPRDYSNAHGPALSSTQCSLLQAAVAISLWR